MSTPNDPYFLTKPEVIIFDWDNTLVDAWSPIHYAVQQTLLKFNKPQWSMDETKIRIHRSLRDTLPQYFPDNSLEEVAAVYRKAYKKVQNQIKALETAQESLDFIKERQIFSAIISNKQNTLLNQEISILKWQDYFDVIIGSGDLHVDKPSPLTVSAVLKKANASSDTVWFIGDSPTDMETAHNAGCIPILFANDEYDESRYAECKPEIHCKDHAQLLEYLKKLV